MSLPSGYEPGPLIHAGSRSRVVRARRSSDGVSVVLKTLASTRPSALAVGRLRREWEIGHSIDHPNVMRYLDVEVSEQHAAIVMEDFHGVSLAERIPQRGFAITRFVDIGLQLSRGLAAIHAERIVHKDIKPRNILVDGGGQRVKYIDFGVSARLDEGEPLSVSPNRLEGTLAYISPEQTGRMNRPLDHRADLYSLGVTFYELLCGHVPFMATEALELVHCHLAKVPEHPRALRPEVPEQLSRIVMRLLAKAPEDRYQSARALLNDLSRCREMLVNAGVISSFELGALDRQAELRVPERLFGRDREIEVLERAWAQAERGRPTIVLVSGSSGVGKSALVTELEARLRDRAGAFISGKFAQPGSGATSEGFTEAFRVLVGRILGATMDELRTWRVHLSQALAINGRVLSNLLPELELIVGVLPRVQALGPEGSQHRYNLVFRRFVRACARDRHPLTIFLDDLQWADPGTLALLELLAHDEAQSHLLLIVAMRDEELEAGHATRLSLEAIRRSSCEVVELPLRELGVAEVEALIAEALGQAPARAGALAELVVERTAGNPLFVRTFLRSAWEEKLLVAQERGEHDKHDQHDEHGRAAVPGASLSTINWRWDEDGLRQMQASESVGELLARRISLLADTTRKTLRCAACFGGSFTLETVAAINSANARDTQRDLEVSARAGMLMLRADGRWDFVHDRVREAAHALLPERERAAAHLRIGRLLLNNTPADRRAERVFRIVDHLGTGRSLIDDPAELVELARLASIAGKRAQRTNAYANAVRYLRTGVECLRALQSSPGAPVHPDPDPDPEPEPGPERGDSTARAWRDHYDLTLRLHRQLAKAEYLCGDVDASLQRINTAMAHARDAVDRVELLDLLVFQQTMATRYAEALATGREALALLDIDLPSSEGDIDQALAELLREYRARLGERPIASLVTLPAMTRRDTMAAARLLSTMMSAAFSADYRISPLITLKLVNLTLAHGALPESGYGYAHHGTFVGSVLGDLEAAHEWGKLALALARQTNDLAQECRACNIVAGYLLPWRVHVSACDSINERGYQAGQESGQLQFVGYIHYHRQLLNMFRAMPLARFEGELSQVLGELEAINHVYAANVIRGLQLVVGELLDEQAVDLQAQSTGSVIRLATSPYVERAQPFLDGCRKDRSFIAICVYQIYYAQVRYLHGDPLGAIEVIAESKEFLPYAIGHVATAERNLFQSLSLIAVLPDLADDRRHVALVTIEHNQEQMLAWSQSCPANFAHMHALVAADLARFDGDYLGALAHYEQAIAGAGEHGFVRIHALANELAARMWLELGNRRLTLPYLSAALSSYRAWGARHKVHLLEGEFGDLCRESPPLHSGHSHPMTVTTDGWAALGSSQALDLATVTRASQAISSEIDLDRLLARMMRIILLNAGANRAFLILEADDDFRIQAAASSDGEAVEVHEKRPLHEGPLALSIVHHVLRSGENVVLEDAYRSGPFTQDPHVLRRQLKSVLCTPIRHKDALVGVLYLENELAAAAFTEARTVVLQILLSQAAISLENARYYNELKTLNDELRERADELAQSKHQLEAEIVERERGQARRRQLEAQLRQSQKMEAIGQLAGGVAHDFNNLLTTVLGSTDVLMSRAHTRGGQPDEAREEIAVIREAAERGAALTRQLLAFSRRQVLQPEVVDLNALARRSANILERLLGAEHELTLDLGDIGAPVRVDPSQIEQVLLNLVINARDASHRGGRVRLSTREVELSEPLAAQPQAVKAGRYVVLRVSDEGSGMNAEIIAHIFEPFFTTKGVGKGTGLGLSMVLGIVQQSDGQITVESSPGRGSAFEVWLPALAEALLPAPPPALVDEPEVETAERSEMIVVVEDEAPVRRTVEQILALHGYEVASAEHGAACLELCARHEGPIDLVLTDFVMPRLGGLELALALRELRPTTRILFMSGFTDGELGRDQIAGLGSIDLIEKPFRAKQLLARIREILDRPS